jgi:signal peptidase I
MDLAHPAALSLLTDLLAGDAATRFTVTGASMRPFLAGGESVILRRVRPGEIRHGDLLLFRQSERAGGRLLLHRVVVIRRRSGLPATIRTQGDALWTPDEPVAEDQVLGRVCAVEDRAPGAEPLDLEARSQRVRALLIVSRQRALRRVRQARAAFGRHQPTVETVV